LRITAVIPTLNEVDSLRQLHAELSAVAEAESYDLEILFVDDGSSDGSWDVIRELSVADSRVRGIRFRRNFGKAAALRAGFEAATGDYVMTLDADLQDDPREIPAFMALMNERNLDVVSGWKQVRHDPWHKVFPSRVFNWLVGLMTGVKLHDHNCGFKCYRRDVVQEVRIYGELHRFIPVLADARGFRVGEIPVKHRPRKYGHSKYGFRRFFKGFLDLTTVTFVTGFGHRPQHVLGSLGLLFLTVGTLGSLIFSGGWIAAIIIGVQLLSVGILAELMTAQGGRDLDTYSIADATDGVRRWEAVHDERRGT
jgi:glycosyltransferase involved in cell wall biosynthesis